MSAVQPLEIVGFLAAAITSVQVARQVVDLRVAGNADAVSLLTWLLAYTQSLGLLAVSWQRMLLAAIFTNAWVGLCSIVIVVMTARDRGRTLLSVVSVTAVTTIILGIWLVMGDASLAGSIGALASGLVWVPQAARSWRTRFGRGKGLSVPMIALGLASSCLWLAYAVLADEWRLGVAPVLAIVSLLVTVYFAFVRRGSIDDPTDE